MTRAEFPLPHRGERVRVRGRLGTITTTWQTPHPHRGRPQLCPSTPPEIHRGRETPMAFASYRRFAEFKFRRQYPCGIYFLDFYCTLAKLAVELDGGGHGFPDQRARDEKRNRFSPNKASKWCAFGTIKCRMSSKLCDLKSGMRLWSGAAGQNKSLVTCPSCPLTPTLSPDGGEGVRTPTRFGFLNFVMTPDDDRNSKYAPLCIRHS